MGDSELPELLESSVEFWGDAYVRVSYALGVLQHVTEEQRECTLFLEARAERAQRAAAAAAPVEQGAERLLRAEASAVVEAGGRRATGERRPSAARPARVPSAGAAKAEEPPAAAAARASAQRPLALPESLRGAAAALAARGVRPGTTLGCYADSLVPAGSPEADAFLARLAAARLRPSPAPPAAADRLTPAAAEEALRWELRALEGEGADWQRRASLDCASHAELCTAAHTVGHVLRLHAELCAALRLREEHARRAVRWRDQAMRCVMREGGAAAEEAALQHGPHAAELWLPPDAWALLPAGDPAQLWPVAEDGALTCTSSAELQALLCARQAAQADALHCLFEGTVAADLARLAAEDAQVLPAGEQAEEAHARLCRLAHALALSSAQRHRAAVIARRVGAPAHPNDA